MRRGRAWAFFFSIAILGVASERAFAGDDPFAAPDQKTDEKAADKTGDRTGAAASVGATDPFQQPAPPVATIRPHAYTLAECLALADRNFPNLWAARSRLAFAHAQLDEAKWVPFWNWNASSNLAVLGGIGGSVMYTASGQTTRNISLSDGLQPWWSVDVSGTIPLYTFGKITAARQAAEANVRFNEWDLEKSRQQARMDVRRAFFGAMLARDDRYILSDVGTKLDSAISHTKDQIAARKGGVDETDRISLEFYKDTLQARAGEPDRGERYAMAALRFYTGVQTAFDIPDEPLKRPDVNFAPLIRYLAAARIFRPEVSMARAGMSARQAQLDLARAGLFPDIGAGFGASYSIAPSAVPQYGNIWASDPFNHFYAGAGLGLRWALDFLPRQARIGEAESQVEEARALERMALGGIAVEVENAYGTAVEADGRERSWDAAEHKAKEWIVTIQDQIDLGTKSDKDMMFPLRNFIDARVNHEQALMDLNVALSDLARAAGWDSAAPTGS